MYFVNPLSMMQQALVSQPGGAPGPSVMPQMTTAAQTFMPTTQMQIASQQMATNDPSMDKSYNPAPQYYGPMHQQIANYFNDGSMWRTDFPRYVNQLMFDPEKTKMHGGLTFRDVVSYPTNDKWRINWFPDAKEGDPAPEPTLLPTQGGNGLLGGGNDGVRAGQNDVGGA